MTPVRRAEREQHIQDCGRHIADAMARFAETGNPADREEAKRWAAMQAEAVNSRTPADVRRLEQERGLL